MTTPLQPMDPKQVIFLQATQELLQDCVGVCARAKKDKTIMLQEEAINLDLNARILFQQLAYTFDASTAEAALNNINRAQVGLLNNELGFRSEFTVAMGFSSIAESLLGIEEPITRTLDLLTEHLPDKITDADKEEVYRALAELVPAPSGTDPVAHGKAMLESETVSNAVRAQALVNAAIKLDIETQKEQKKMRAIYDTAKKTDEAGFTALEHMSSSSLSSSSFSSSSFSFSSLSSSSFSPSSFSSSSFSSSSLASDSSSTLSSFSFTISRTDSSSVGELPQSQGDGSKRLSFLLPKPLFSDQTPTVSSDTPVNKEKPSEASLQPTGPKQDFVQRSKALLKECAKVCKQARKGTITDLQKTSTIELDLTARRLIKELAENFDARTANDALNNINYARVCLLNHKLGFTSKFSVTMGFSSVAESLLRIKEPITRNLDLLTDHMVVKITDADKEEVYRALAELDPAPSGKDPVAHGKAMLTSKTVSNAVRAQALINAGAKLDKVTQKEKENMTALHGTAKKTKEAGFTAQEHMSSSSLSSDSSSTLSSFYFMISRTDSSSSGELPQTQSDVWKRLDSLLPKPLFRDQTPTVSSDTPVKKEKPSEAPVSRTITVETTTVPTTLKPEAQTSLADAEKSKEDLTQI